MRFIFLVFISGCLYPESYWEVDAERIPIYYLCNADSVAAFRLKNADKYQYLAQRYLQKSMDEKFSENERIIFLKKSLSLYPDRETYFQLGIKLLNGQRVEESFEVFDFLVNKSGAYQSKDPLHNLLYAYVSYIKNQKQNEGLKFSESEKKLLRKWINPELAP